MKKQKQNKLAFNKAIVTELNPQQLKIVNGGIAIKEDDGTVTLSGCICNPISLQLTITKRLN
jgi:hypothetical protein